MAFFFEVNLKGVRLERLRDFGDVWLGLDLWRLPGLDKLLSEIIPNGIFVLSLLKLYSSKFEFFSIFKKMVPFYYFILLVSL
jgi:hypothetical protein